MTLLPTALLASLSTGIGGAFALRFRDKLHLILGFSAGAVAGVALFDLLPEAIELGTAYHTPEITALLVACGFFGYLILDRLVLLHTHAEDDEVQVPRGFVGALTLSAHSFLDGVAIGVGFQASPLIGTIVTTAVLTHDFSDGINTVNIVLRNRGGWRLASAWLFVDAIAPLLGATSTLLFTMRPEGVSLVLAAFVGSFLYLSASDLIPESHHRHPRALTTIMTLFGAALMYLVVQAV